MRRGLGALKLGWELEMRRRLGALELGWELEMGSRLETLGWGWELKLGRQRELRSELMIPGEAGTASNRLLSGVGGH